MKYIKNTDLYNDYSKEINYIKNFNKPDLSQYKLMSDTIFQCNKNIKIGFDKTRGYINQLNINNKT